MDPTASIKCPKCSEPFALEEAQTTELLAIEFQLKDVLTALRDLKQSSLTNFSAPEQHSCHLEDDGRLVEHEGGIPIKCPHSLCSSRSAYANKQGLERHYKTLCKLSGPKIDKVWDHECPNLSASKRSEWRKELWLATKNALQQQWEITCGRPMTALKREKNVRGSSALDGSQKRQNDSTDVATSDQKRQRISSGQNNAPVHSHKSDHTQEASPSSDSSHQNEIYHSMINPLPNWFDHPDLIMDDAGHFPENNLQCLDSFQTTSGEIQVAVEHLTTQYIYPPNQMT
ncbi:hypothetical protein BKA56DRAFT_193655 [Ilyonectria sp. MPI-CAGE-AT-0026]|nr:hypothetical protein BKA56DRAFT_193655 [Ilyonectria sp. MPI-CAGE-AT-0026]